MAEHTSSGPAELGAAMDYAEHDRTFAGFVALTKIASLAIIGIVQALTLFGIASNGFWLGVIQIVLVVVAAITSMVTKGSLKWPTGVVVLGFIFMALALG